MELKLHSPPPPPANTRGNPKTGFRVVPCPHTGRRYFYWNGVLITAETLRDLGEPALRAAWQAMPQEQRDHVSEQLRTEWAFWARPEQLVPKGEWVSCLVLAGRGFGKSRMGAQAVLEWYKQGFNYINLIGATNDDSWDIMVDGESGLLAVAPQDIRPTKKRHERKLVWPNGAVSLVFTADEPERLRGKQHQKIWADEVCAWRYPEAWDQVLFGLRLASPECAEVKTPQGILTTTPKPTKMLRELMKDPTTVVVRGKTSDNRENLAPSFYGVLQKKYEGTRLGRQELDAEVLEDNAGALWNRAAIDSCRRSPFVTLEDGSLLRVMPEFARIVVAIDPAVTSKKKSDECGIVVVGVDVEGQGYVLEDVTPPERVSPDAWAKRAVGAFHRWRADRVIAEVNNGGDLVESVIRAHDPSIPFKAVHASKGKITRAEPVAALYEQGRVTHLGSFAKLEDQMCEYNPTIDPGDSPDRMDALVWGLTELMLGDNQYGGLDFIRSQVERKVEEKKQRDRPKEAPVEHKQLDDETPEAMLARVAGLTTRDAPLGAPVSVQRAAAAVESASPAEKAMAARMAQIDSIFNDPSSAENPDGW